LNCDAGQGNLFARPLDVDRAAALLKAGLASAPARAGIVTAGVDRDERRSPLWMRGKLFVTGNRASFAAAACACAATLAVLFSGFPAASRSRTPVAERRQQRSGDASVPRVSALAQEPAAAPPSFEKSPVTLNNETSTAVAPPLPKAVGASPVGTPPGLASPISVDVLHLHRLGTCRGRLELTRGGVAFIASGDADESFTLKYTEFLPALADDTLTLKSATKTYRFKAVAAGSEHRVQLRELADRIASAPR
jgi:hypothetical protein